MPALGATLALVAPAAAAAATIAVPGDYETIEEAISAAAPGDTVTVAAGTWAEKLSIDKDLSLVGAGSASTTLTFPNGPLIDVGGGTVTLSGFTFEVTIRNRGMVVSGGAEVDIDDLVMNQVQGNQDGGAMKVEGAGTTVSLSASRLSTTLGAPTRGGLIQVMAGASFSATDTTFEAAAAVDGGAIWADLSTVSLLRCTLTGNEAQRGGAVFLVDGDLLVEDCALVDNVASDGGGAVYVESGDAVQVSGSMLCANDAEGSSGGGAWVSEVSGTNAWQNNAFVENSAVAEGGALYVEDTAIIVVNNHFLTHSAATGGAVSLRDADVAFVNNLVAWTAVGDGLAATWSGTASWSLGYSDWWSNIAVDVSGDLTAADLDATHLYEDPELVDYTPDGDCTNDDLAPDTASPLVDAGDPSLLDEDGSRSDIGAFGGTGSDLLIDADGDGWIAVRDCDDDDPDVNPGAQEVCDPENVDEDCDGDSDDADASATGTSSWCADADGDGYGDPSTEAQWCDPPSGHVEDCTDCDDADPDTNPGAAEIHGDGLDQDCTGHDALVEWSGGGCAGCGSGAPGPGWLVLLAGIAARRRRA